MITGYRSHTQAIAKGISGNQVFAELFGKVTGCSRGKGGSMHMFSKEQRFLGGHGIVGGQAPLATGAAFRIKYMKEDDVVVCYLGDAAMNQGQVYEAMNMAATWDLPVLFIIENNQYGMGTDIRRTTSVDHLYKRALGFDMAHSMLDAMDVENVYDSVDKIVKKMRKDKKPHLLEALCYRYKGHSVSDPQNYRTKEEVAEWMKKDPLIILADKLKKEKLASDADLELWDEEARSSVRANEKFADESPNPELAEAWMHVYAD
jgi:pyruvate dehydrogenase E1 component alpha subunit